MTGQAPPAAAASRRHPALAAVLVLTFATGVIDAATYLGLHGVFTANMTGNVIFIGLGLADHAAAPLLRSVLALAGFLAGAAVVGRFARGRPAGAESDGVAAWALVAVAAVVAAAAVLLAAATAPSAAALDGVATALAAAMGAQAVAARRIGVPDVTTVVVTSTLAVLASDLHVAGRAGDRAATQRRAGAVAAMLLGSFVGALLLRWQLSAAVGLSAALIASVAAAALRSGAAAQTHVVTMDTCP